MCRPVAYRLSISSLEESQHGLSGVLAALHTCREIQASEKCLRVLPSNRQSAALYITDQAGVRPRHLELEGKSGFKELEEWRNTM